jgi:hypothetical protein
MLPLYLIHGSEFIKGISTGPSLPVTWTSAYCLSPELEYVIMNAIRNLYLD